jgi:hypothetical protein
LLELEDDAPRAPIYQAAQPCAACFGMRAASMAMAMELWQASNILTARPFPRCARTSGALQDAGTQLAGIADAVLGHGYAGLVDFTLTVSVPAALLVRQAAFAVLAREYQGEALPSTPMGCACVELKDAIKWVGGAMLAGQAALGIPVNVMSAFQVQLTYTHDETAAECDFLLHVKEAAIKLPKQSRVRHAHA